MILLYLFEDSRIQIRSYKDVISYLIVQNNNILADNISEKIERKIYNKFHDLWNLV